MILYKLLIYDNEATMDHVVGTLMSMFKMTVNKANEIMEEAYINGAAVIDIFPQERAEMYRGMLEEMGLKARIEPDWG
jgi:ATP-dependent Clp protease adapter protein ClpS